MSVIEHTEFKGLVVPKSSGTPQAGFCSRAKCEGITCENCLFDGVNIRIFEEWLKQQLDKRIPEGTYLKNHEASGLKIGDKVRITRVAGSCEKGWDNSWAEAMTESVGDILTIINDCMECGFQLSNNFMYPYFTLEKIKCQHIDTTPSLNRVTCKECGATTQVSVV